MRTSRFIASMLFLLSLVFSILFALLSQAGRVQAQNAARPVQSAAYQSNGQTDATRNCHDEEVQTDEGYGVSRVEIRRVCH